MIYLNQIENIRLCQKEVSFFRVDVNVKVYEYVKLEFPLLLWRGVYLDE